VPGASLGDTTTHARDLAFGDDLDRKQACLAFVNVAPTIHFFNILQLSPVSKATGITSQVGMAGDTRKVAVTTNSFI
jgi:hypothetical protein